MSEDEQVSRPSRYRSLRKQTISAPAPPSAMRTTNGNHDPDQRHGNAAANSISRSMSRYRRRAASVTADTDNHAAQTMSSGLNNAPPVPAIPPSLKPAVTGGHTEHMAKSSSQCQLRHTETRRRNIGQTIDESDDNPKVAYDSNRGQTIMSSRGMQNGSLAPRDVSWEEERDRLLEEQKRKDLRRLEEELECSQRVKAQSHKLRSPVVEKFMALAKGSKNSNDGMSPASPMTTSTRSSARRSDQEPVKTLPAHIEPGGKGIVPQKDAPTSAINAGDRNVVVRYRHHTFNLHITPETTAVDIITQTSSKTAYDVEISPERSLVVEQYSILGLERRLRRYERIRDVMNSWDSDAQNQLAIVLPDSHENHEDLDVSAVAESEEPPSGCQLYMYHSNRPGKWNKRWITLLQSGQIVCAKKPNAKMTDKDTASLCHLSDYDIYTPTESQMRRHMKPPKRFCFAIKSQHKTTLFLNTDNYVQYFSTEDPSVAREFKQKAHSWRSWYLVDRNPEARKKNTGLGARTEDSAALASPLTKYASNKSDNVAAVNGQRLRVSTDESPYSIGQFEPLLDMKRFDKRLSQFGKEVPTPQSDPPSKHIADQRIRRRLSKREKPGSIHPQAFKRDSEDGFTGGLLGEEYDSRKQALTDSEKKKRPQELAFIEGPSLLNSQQDPELATEKPESPSWFPSAQEHTAKQRTNHQITAVRPLASGNVASGRHLSLGAATHRPAGLVSSAARPSTQHSSQHTSSRTHTQPHPDPLGSQPTGLPNSDRHAPSKPLVDLTPTFQEPPQWSKDKKGHGVKPPEGLGHLVDFISAGNGTDSASNRSIIRRPTTSGPAPLGRTRSMSAATSSGRPLLDDIPPMPPLPSRFGLESDPNGRRLTGAPVSRDGRVDRRETVRHREREQEKARHREREREQRDREYREREAAYNAVPGRTGTLKVV
ncbi:hypothetical protein F4801DRAFT_517642 [Xylaria longipes]|nr:hypothetical protein F4801DRAFT_517642 [Xylaria longipes]